jgi:TonB-linked SusC/RagA family outer membrane protein
MPATRASLPVHQHQVQLAMKKRMLITPLMGIFLFAAQALAQQKTVTGKVTDEQGAPMPSVSVVIQGTRSGTLTNLSGSYSIRAAEGQVLQFRFIGTTPVERTVGSADVINVQLKRAATALDAVVVTALGQTTAQRALGTSQQQVTGAQIAGTQRPSFINALQGRVAGVNVTSSSGVPGASSSITIRGVSSISSSNQPLMIVDGLPVDNKTLNTSALPSDRPGSSTAFNNRGVDFTNRAADINPEDIESVTVLKGPEAAALYGIDAANGAIVITTKRGKAGAKGIDYSNSIAYATVRSHPEIQQVYGISGYAGVGATVGATTPLYYGPKYAAGTPFFDNVDGFFRTGVSQTHNLAFNGAAADNRVNYRLAAGVVRQTGVEPKASYNRVNITGASQADVNSWLKADVSMGYTNSGNEQSFKGDNGPLLGLLVWPSTDNASDYLSVTGARRRLTAANSEVDNPYFSVNKNFINSKVNRLIANVGLTVTPFSWGYLKTNLGADTYANQNLLLRHPESVAGITSNGIIDQADDVTRNLTEQTLLNFNSRQLTRHVSVTGLIGNEISDAKSTVDGGEGTNFLDNNFVSVNNTLNRTSTTVISQRRLLSGFAQAVFDYDHYLYLTIQGRNDWTSTIPQERNSFFYPSISASYVYSDAFPAIGRHMTGKLRAAFAEVGRDARPYAYRSGLEAKTTSYGGYGYGFTGPNPNLRPEFAKSYELGSEMTFLDNRAGLDVTVYRKQTTDQIVNDVRASYATGFILFNLNGAVTRNQGLEITLRGTPILKNSFSWDFLANFESARGKVLALPNDFPEAYVSDTFLYGNVRNGVTPGVSIMSLTGLYYLRNNAGQILIDPSSGLPLRSTTFTDAGYDRQPNFTIGLSNEVKYKRVSLNVLLDIRRGGDVFNATQHYLTQRGLSLQTLDRDVPRVIPGVLRDGKENSANPTPNSIVVIPSVQTLYYQNMSEELFIEKNINWVRLRDVTLNYTLPERFLGGAGLFVTATDLALWTNYSGLDPIVNGNTAAVGGSGAVGIDYGNFPVPRGINVGLKVAF